MRLLTLVVVLLLAACTGDDGEAGPALLDVTILDSGERRSQAFRLTGGRLSPVADLGRRTVFTRAGSEPDRQSIAWEEVYLREADGSVTRLTRDRRADLTPQLLKDGRVAFISCAFSDEPDALPDCALVAIEPETRRREVLLGDLGVVFGGELSPDERRLLYAPLEEWGAPKGLFVRDLDGGETRRLADGEAGTWSPDGTRIAFLSDRDEHGRCLFHDCIGHADELYVADADGSNEQRLTESFEDEGEPEWSGDGEWVVTGRIPDEDADWDLYAVRADGECERQLTDTARWEVAAEWHGGGHGGLSCD